MRVCLVRHGIAIDHDDPHCPPEPERYLTPKGIDKTREAAEGLRALEIAPDVILTSPYLRAVQTAEIVAEVLGFKKALKRTEALLPEADPAQIFTQLCRVNASTTILVGHAPHVDAAIAAAVGAPEPVTMLKKAGAAVLDIVSLIPPRATLECLHTPKSLRLLGR